MPDERRDTSFAGLLAALRRRWYIVVLCAVIAPAAAVAYSSSREKQYSASAVILFSDRGPGEQLLTQAGPPSAEDRKRNVATSVSLISLRPVADRVAEELGGGADPDRLIRSVIVETDDNADTATLRTTDRDPERAARIANLFAEQFIESRRESGRTAVREAQAVVEREFEQLSRQRRQGERGDELRVRIQDLELLAALQSGNAELVGRARPADEPVSPRPRRDGILAALLGLVLAVALALLVDRLDRRIRDSGEIESTLDVPVLGVVPPSRRELRSGDWVRVGKVAEAFRSLRVNLRYLNVSRPVRSVLVNSAGEGEGKTTVAVQLAYTAAAAGADVLLVEADMRRPAFDARLGLDQPVGLPDVLAGLAELDQVVAVHSLDPSGEHETATIDVISAGHNLPPNPGDLLESPRMARLLQDTGSHYDMIVIDAPPITSVSDAVPLLRLVSGTLVVTRLGTTTRGALAGLRSLLDQLAVPVLGVVINGAEAEGYGYAGQKPSRATRRRRKRASAVAAAPTAGAYAPDAGFVEPDAPAGFDDDRGSEAVERSGEELAERDPAADGSARGRGE